MAPETRGRKRLLEWMAKDPKGRTATLVAKAVGVTQPSVSGWVGRTSRPDAQRREAIQSLTGGYVVVDDWYTPSELRTLRRVQPMPDPCEPAPATGTDPRSG